MKVFISWSKEPSRQVAELLSEWLPDVIQSLKPWVSKDIVAGTRWNTEIAKELSSTTFGIICVTKLNQHEPWLQFEAGALAKTLDNQTHVCPYLIDMAESDLQGPLVAFQSVKASKDGTAKLIRALNNALGRTNFEPLSDEKLSKAFAATNWNDYDQKLRTIIGRAEVPQTNQTSLEDIVTEILATTRETSRQFNRLNEFIDVQTRRSVGFTERFEALPIVTVTFSVNGPRYKLNNFRTTLNQLGTDFPHLEASAQEMSGEESGLEFDTVYYTLNSRSKIESEVFTKRAEELANRLSLEWLPF